MEYKTYTLKAPEFTDDQGAVTARFATMEVLDKDDDWTAKGAFGEQPVRISAYGHGSWRGALPVGKGRIYERGQEAIFDGRFFLSTETGREHYHTVKEMGDLQEWSYALPQIESEMRDMDGRKVRVLKRIVVPEVSPVLLGAGLHTATLDIKAQDGQRLEEAMVDVIAQVEAVLERLEAVKSMREEVGRRLSPARVTQMKNLQARLSRLFAVGASPDDVQQNLALLQQFEPLLRR